MNAELMTETLKQRIRAAMERIETPDVAAIADLVVADLDPDEVRYFARVGISERVRAEMYKARHPKTPIPGSARWDAAKSSHESGELDLMRFAIWTGRNHKWVLDCTAADLTDAAEEAAKQARGYREAVVRYEKLARALRRAKGSVVGDLPPGKVRQILTEEVDSNV